LGNINIYIKTKYDKENNYTIITIEDDGVGIVNELLQTNEDGIKKIFLENETTKSHLNINSGYGCYIAYQMAVGRCGWNLDAENLADGGCRFTIIIKN